MTDLILKVLAGLGAIAAFWIGVQQWQRGQAWQRATVVVELIDSFNAGAQIKAACHMLEWEARPIVLDSGLSIDFTNEMLISALRVSPMDIVSTMPNVDSAFRAQGFSQQEQALRDDFDRFFDFFDKLHALRKSELLKFSDHSYSHYWFELLQDLGTYKGDQRIKQAVDTYIRANQFYGIQELLKHYAKGPQITIGCVLLSGKARSITVFVQYRGNLGAWQIIQLVSYFETLLQYCPEFREQKSLPNSISWSDELAGRRGKHSLLIPC